VVDHKCEVSVFFDTDECCQQLLEILIAELGKARHTVSFDHFFGSRNSGDNLLSIVMWFRDTPSPDLPMCQLRFDFGVYKKHWRGRGERQKGEGFIPLLWCEYHGMTAICF